MPEIHEQSLFNKILTGEPITIEVGMIGSECRTILKRQSLKRNSRP